MSEYISVGSSKRIRAEHMRALGRAWNERRLVLFLGAGVSSDYGVPQWNSLIQNLLYGANQLEGYWPNYRMALLSRLSTQFDFSPVTLARVVKHMLLDKYLQSKSGEKARKKTLIDFKQQVRQQLYGKPLNPQHYTTLKAVADLIEKSESAPGGRRIQAVLTTNFDDLLETEIERRAAAHNGARRRVLVERVHDERRRTGAGLPVIHVHGLIPKEGAIPEADIVFTEDDYHRLTYSLFHWAINEITNYLYNYTVLFVGVSMSDPNLRRLLDATYMREQFTEGGDPKLYHYLMRKDYTLSDEDKEKTIDAVIADAERFGEGTEAEMMRKSHHSVKRAVEEMLDKAHVYDSDLFRYMGVGVVWAEKFEDFPKILKAIPNFGQSARGR